MLCLTRKKMQAIYLHVPGYSEPIEVLVADLDGRQVRLAIAAPRDVHVRRGELPETKGAA